MSCERVKVLEDFIEKLFKEKVSECVCDYCEHNVPCLGKECDCYEEGVGLYDTQGKYYDWKWSCMDITFGTCDKLKDTPCGECVENSDWIHFKWNGKT